MKPFRGNHVRQIYDKALREKAVKDLQTLLDSVKGLPDGSDERAEAYTHALEALLEKEKQMTVRYYHQTCSAAGQPI